MRASGKQGGTFSDHGLHSCPGRRGGVDLPQSFLALRDEKGDASLLDVFLDPVVTGVMEEQPSALVPAEAI